MSALDRVEVAGDDSHVYVTCLDCGADLDVHDGSPSGYWPTVADLVDAAIAHRCTITGEVPHA